MAVGVKISGRYVTGRKTQNHIIREKKVFFRDPFSNNEIFPEICKHLRVTANKYYGCLKKNNWLPFFNKNDIEILKNLNKIPNLIISRPDKGKGVVLVDRTDYLHKMNTILEDTTKFTEITTSPFQTCQQPGGQNQQKPQNYEK